MNTYLLNALLLSTLAVAAFVVYTKVIDAPAHTDPAIPIPYSNLKGTVMLAVAEAVKTRSNIPPIDAAVPKITETATFAMG